jgi:hypothetical protein
MGDQPGRFRRLPGLLHGKPGKGAVQQTKAIFAAPLTITVSDGFKQKIDVNWPGAHDDIFVVCQVSVKRGGLVFFKGTTSGESKRYVEGLKNGDQLIVKSTKIMKPYASATYKVTFSAEQATPVVINLSPNFVDVGL